MYKRLHNEAGSLVYPCKNAFKGFLGGGLAVGGMTRANTGGWGENACDFDRASRSCSQRPLPTVRNFFVFNNTSPNGMGFRMLFQA